MTSTNRDLQPLRPSRSVTERLCWLLIRVLATVVLHDGLDLLRGWMESALRRF